MLSSFAAVAILAMAAAGGPAFAEPAPVQPQARVFHLGRLELVALRDADNVVANDGRTFGVGVAVLTAAGAAPDPITLSVDALLVKGGGRVMLFDTGLGPAAHGVLLQSLARAGIAPGQVSDVFITHSHGDHIGGLVTPQGGSAFPHAAIHISDREWVFLTSNGRSAAVVSAVAAQVRTFTPGSQVTPGVSAVALYGHTPGHVGYRISSDGHTLFDVGDSAHSAIVSLARPQWAIEYDQDPAAGRASREATLAQLADSHVMVFAPHFPFPGVGRVQRSGAAYVWASATTAE